MGKWAKIFLEEEACRQANNLSIASTQQLSSVLSEAFGGRQSETNEGDSRHPLISNSPVLKSVTRRNSTDKTDTTGYVSSVSPSHSSARRDAVPEVSRQYEIGAGKSRPLSLDTQLRLIKETETLEEKFERFCEMMSQPRTLAELDTVFQDPFMRLMRGWLEDQQKLVHQRRSLRLLEVGPQIYDSGWE